MNGTLWNSHKRRLQAYHTGLVVRNSSPATTNLQPATLHQEPATSNASSGTIQWLSIRQYFDSHDLNDLNFVIHDPIYLTLLCFVEHNLTVVFTQDYQPMTTNRSPPPTYHHKTNQCHSVLLHEIYKYNHSNNTQKHSKNIPKLPSQQPGTTACQNPFAATTLHHAIHHFTCLSADLSP